MTNKRFNITGLCVPAMHYMVDTGAKIETIIREYIEPSEYFVINRARQYGKTTTLRLLERALSDRYLVIRTSFEGAEGYFESRDNLVNGLCARIATVLCNTHPDLAGIILEHSSQPDAMDDLSARITALCQHAKTPVILIIDEVDRASDYAVFASFLGMLRQKYLDRPDAGVKSTFHSVILAGVHDIKNLKARIRPDSEHAYNSPWNIAAPFDVDMSFAPVEIATMLTGYEADYHTDMDINCVSERLYYHTNGYPFLVSALCQLIHEKNLGWNEAGADTAADLLMQETNTLFDDLIKNMQRHVSFHDVVAAILLRGETVSYVPADPDVSLGLMFGIFRREGRRAVISNRIFEAYIYDYLIMKEKKRNQMLRLLDQSVYIHNGVLSMDTVIERFAELMHREYRRETSSLVEAEGRLLFLAYLRPIINGAGHYYVEVLTRNNTRMDVVVTFGNQVFIVELKVWHGEEREKDAYDQLAGYVKSQNETTGYLISFCDLQKKPREGRTFTHDGTEIHETIIAYKDVV
jgi:hypothetical protein